MSIQDALSSILQLNRIYIVTCVLLSLFKNPYGSLFDTEKFTVL
jgi:hypothetical protein